MGNPNGPERRKAERDGAITYKEAQGALARVLAVSEFTEGGKMRQRINELVTSNTDGAVAENGDPQDLRRNDDMKLKNTEHIEFDERLRTLVVDPINALPEAQRTNL